MSTPTHVDCARCGTTVATAHGPHGTVYGYCARCERTTDFGDLSLSIARPFLASEDAVERWYEPTALASRVAWLVKLGAPPAVLEQLHVLWETWRSK